MSGATINNALVSVIVLSYNSRDCVSRVLHSIFMQDYPRIEIVVADDGSEDYCSEYINSIFELSAGKNIERHVLLDSNENMGTVSNLHRALSVIEGDYFVVLGADDSLADPEVLSCYMREFRSRNWTPLLVTGLAEMWSRDMDVLHRTIPEQSGVEVLRSEDPSRLFNSLAYECVIPIVATCFRRDFVEAVDAFDKSYRYYEDYPTFLRMARKGITPAYLNRVMTKHAAGGVANGGTKTSKKVLEGLHRDRVRMWKREVDPYVNRLDGDSIRRYRARKQNEARKYNEERRLYDAGGISARAKVLVDSVMPLLHSKPIHRLNLSFELAVLCLLACLGFLCLGDAFIVFVALFAGFSVVFALSAGWFAFCCLSRFVRKRE